MICYQVVWRHKVHLAISIPPPPPPPPRERREGGCPSNASFQGLVRHASRAPTLQTSSCIITRLPRIWADPMRWRDRQVNRRRRTGRLRAATCTGQHTYMAGGDGFRLRRRYCSDDGGDPEMESSIWARRPTAWAEPVAVPWMDGVRSRKSSVGGIRYRRILGHG